jgi:hypothetical protein
MFKKRLEYIVIFHFLKCHKKYLNYFQPEVFLKLGHEKYQNNLLLFMKMLN